MKKQLIYIFSILIFITSCASKTNKIASNNTVIKVNDSIKDKYEALNDFFDDNLKEQSKKIIIASKKINTNMTLRILRINDIYSRDSITGKYQEDKTLYNEEEWEKARKKYSKNSVTEIENANDRGGECCWVAENFNNKKIIFEDLQQGTTAYEKKYLSDLNYDLYDLYSFYYFSEPIYYQNKEYIIFTVFKTSILGGLDGTAYIVVMKKKKNGKWIQTHEGMPNWIS